MPIVDTQINIFACKEGSLIHIIYSALTAILNSRSGAFTFLIGITLDPHEGVACHFILPKYNEVDLESLPEELKGHEQSINY